MSRALTLAAIALVATGLSLGGCGTAPEVHPAKLPLSSETMMLLGKKGMTARSPIFMRIFKEESELEIWKARSDGHFYHFKTYPICTWSGKLGPKYKQGDKQAPEGFYSIKTYLMNPNSKHHLAFNLGYPNAYDKSRGRTGNFLMVHGKCSSAGCYAMTDALIEEIYGLARDAFNGGQRAFQVQAFPFRMTNRNMRRHADNRSMPFWRTLKVGYDDFNLTKMPPKVDICGRRYHVNVEFPGRSRRSRLNATKSCPRFRKMALAPFEPASAKAKQIASQRITMPGRKRRSFAGNTSRQTAPQSQMALTGGNDAGLLFGFGMSQ